MSAPQGQAGSLTPIRQIKEEFQHLRGEFQQFGTDCRRIFAVSLNDVISENFKCVELQRSISNRMERLVETVADMRQKDAIHLEYKQEMTEVLTSEREITSSLIDCIQHLNKLVRDGFATARENLLMEKNAALGDQAEDMSKQIAVLEENIDSLVADLEEAQSKIADRQIANPPAKPATKQPFKKALRGSKRSHLVRMSLKRNDRLSRQYKANFHAEEAAMYREQVGLFRETRKLRKQVARQETALAASSRESAEKQAEIDKLLVENENKEEQIGLLRLENEKKEEQIDRLLLDNDNKEEQIDRLISRANLDAVIDLDY